MHCPGIEPRNFSPESYCYTTPLHFHNLTTEMVFINLKIFRCHWGLNPESSSPESLNYTTRPPSHNSPSEYVVYIQCTACELLVNPQYSILLMCTLEKKIKNEKKNKKNKK